MEARDTPVREFCGVCHEVNRVGFHVPDHIWKAVVHPSRVNDIHCLNCFTKRADEKMIDWDKDIRFWPVSFASHRAFVEEFEGDESADQRRAKELSAMSRGPGELPREAAGR